jgi:hypothetical protein
MFSCVCSLWSAARNRGIRAQIPNERVYERVFSQCFWPGPEWKYLKAHKQSCSSEIFISTLKKHNACKKYFWVCYLKQIFTVNSAQYEFKLYTLHLSILNLVTHPSEDHTFMQVQSVWLLLD